MAPSKTIIIIKTTIIMIIIFLVIRSPDGTCILTCNNDNILRLYNLPNELYTSSFPDQLLPEMV